MRGSGTGTTSPKPKEPVVERKPDRYFFSVVPLAASTTIAYGTGVQAVEAGVAAAATSAAGAGELVASVIVPWIAPGVGIVAGLWPKEANSGESKMLAAIRGDQIYRTMQNGVVVGAYSRLNQSVLAGDFLTDGELRELAEANGSALTRVRHRFETDYGTGEVIDQSYDVGEKSGLNRVRVRFAKQVNESLWSFEDPDTGSTLVWSRSGEKGEFSWGSNPSPWGGNATLPHNGPKGEWTTPPTPIPEERKPWGLPNPEPISIPPLPPTPRPEPKKADIEYIPIHETSFNDYIIVDPMGKAPSIYVYFRKAKVPAVEFIIDYYGKLKEKYLNTDKDGNKVEFDHLPSQAAVKQKILREDPLADDKKVTEKMNWVAAIIITTKAHRQDSETFGGRQHQKVIDIYGQVMKRSVRDGKDLRAAVDSNWNTLSRKLVEKYGLPESEIEPMRARIHELNEAQGWYK